MNLRNDISLSKKAMRIFANSPRFFAPVLNALYDLHTEHGFRKPRLSSHTNELWVDFRGKTCDVLMFLEVSAGRVFLVDSRVTSDKKYSTFRDTTEATFERDISDFLSSRFASLVEPSIK